MSDARNELKRKIIEINYGANDRVLEITLPKGKLLLWKQFLGKETRMDHHTNTKVEVNLAYLRREAERGDEDAAYILYKATGSAEGANWICLAAHDGNPVARMEYGRFQWYGYPPYQEDRIVGYMWKKIATATGYYGGDELVSERAAMLTSDELSQAERLIEEWKPDPTECETVASVGQ